MAKHPAKYTNSLIPIFADLLRGRRRVLDPFAGTCKIAEIRDHGFEGEIFCNEIEPEWAQLGHGKCDLITTDDAEFLRFGDGFFDAICTSPTYGNRMADSHNARDASRRITYTHTLGRKLHEQNTGKMQWGKIYRAKHQRIYRELFRVLCEDGLFVINVSDHIRGGEVIEVSRWHQLAICATGFTFERNIPIETPRMRFGQNSNLRVQYENVMIFRKETTKL